MKYRLLAAFVVSVFVMTTGGDAPLAKKKSGKMGPKVQKMADQYSAKGEPEAEKTAKKWKMKIRQAKKGPLVGVIVEPEASKGPWTINPGFIQSIGGSVDAVSKSYMRVLVPFKSLKLLAKVPGVRLVRAPTPAKAMEIGFGPNLNESVSLTGASDLQNAGITGAGVKVAVVDLGFIGLTDAIAAGELPAGTVRVKGNVEGASIEVDTEHGVGVSEHVLDMAPGVDLYCIYVEDEVDLENAAAYIRDNGILVANHSVGWVNSSYYDDTGPIAGIINDSRDLDGVFWAVSAGNDAEAHWRGGWTDGDGDDVLDFFGGDEWMGLSGSYSTAVVFLNWDQYGNSVTDLDLYALDNGGSVVARSEAWQTGAQDPAEAVSFTVNANKAPYSLQVQHYAGPTVDLDMSMFSFYHDFEYPVAAASLMEPSDAHGAYSVAAVYFGDWNLTPPPPEPYSSQGPTTDGRPKPDIAAPDGTTSWTYGFEASYGTSFSSPTTAGAAALLFSEDPSRTAGDVAAELTAMAEDVGDPGPDYVYGAGKLHLEVSGCTSDPECDDGLYCNGAETCDGAGDCQPGTAVDCSGLNDQCNTGECDDGADACVAQSVTDGTSCDDGLYCNAGETCTGGTCGGGSPADCSSLDGVCVAGTCNEASDQCEETPSNEGGTCSDGDACTSGETCQTGNCQGGVDTDCSHLDDTCNTGSCNPTSGLCEALPGNEGGACDDGLYCTVLDTCSTGTCTGTQRDCSASGDACNEGTCNEVTDACEAVPVPEGGACDDGLYCITGESCTAGTCSGGSALDCDDGVTCTSDSCDEAADACDNVPVDASCADGLYCNGAESCDGLLGCQAGTTVTCDDAVSCTVDSCNEATDSCDHTASDAACDDGLYCNGVETCDGLLGCQAGLDVDCDDGNPCTLDSCNESTDSCDHTASDVACDDGLYCNGVETCDGLLGCQAGTTVTCDDAVSCTVDSCNEATDSCDFVPSDAACDDGQFCNGDEVCTPGVGCQAGTLVTCDDAMGCTADTCNESTDSCDHVPNDGACADGLYCNGVETCDTLLDCQAGTDPCPGQGCDDGMDACVAGAAPFLSTGTGTSSAGWTDVTLGRSYGSMVVVAVPNYDSADAPAVVRIRNAVGNGFQFAVQAADGTNALLAGVDVHWFAVEEGVYTVADHGVKMEAVKYLSTLTDRNGSWGAETRSYAQAYSSPVVLGQVMTYNDEGWSTFWSRNSSSYKNPPDSTLKTGKHVGEDSDTTRLDETVGYVVLEAGTGTMVTVTGTPLEYTAALGADSIKGMGDAPPYSYALSGLSTVGTAVAIQTAMDGNNGGWAVLYGTGALSSTTLNLAVDEDVIKDTERKHITEQVGYVVFEEEAMPECTSDPDCDDGLYCNGAEICDGNGACQAGTAVACDDGVACTTDFCDETSDSCDATASDAACDDGLFCNGDETCDAVAGCQAGTAVTCNDGIACTTDSCDEAADACAWAPDDAPCADGLFCNGDEVCTPGVGCEAGTAVACEDGVGCTLDTCDEATDSCDYGADDGLCNDGLYCNGTETCDAFLDCQNGLDPCPGQGCDEAGDVCVAGGAPYLSTGIANSAGDWATVSLGRTYDSMVVVASTRYDSSGLPAVVRIRNAVGNQFEFLVQAANGSNAAIAGVEVQYLVVEEGVYGVAIHGVKMEAAKYTSTVTDRKSSWNAETRSYGQTYSNPVVLGQVMTYNDTGWSAFWCRSTSNKSNPPNGTLKTGKHVGEDPDTTRADETVGYVVIETGYGNMGTVDGVLAYTAALGADSVKGVGDVPPYSYSLSGLSSASTAVVTMAAMDGGNGGWAILYGDGAVSPTSLKLAVEEDTAKDTERKHTPEQVGYIVFE